MIKKIFMSVAVLACTLGSIEMKAQTAVDSAYNNGYYQLRMEYFDEVPSRKKEIVFLGNSITEAGDWLDILPKKRVANRGISGDISFGVLARLDKILENKPAKIFLLIGVNDLKREIPKELIIQNYRKIVNRVRTYSPKTRLFLQSVLPVNEEKLIEPFKKVKMEDIVYLNEALQEIAKENQIEYINLWEVLGNKEGQLIERFTPDGIHLKPIAYIKWVDYLKKKKYL
ncbi:GDSL-type esterase/lipase family protein [Rapidithrix thailandica]|uniref:GDSL-type esterase/lipase family protein n=1 Tax=Rapidithrix thailandica TaxID=413964 RepID=A0AAW9RW37_9BACT